jgi:lipopolysaccharide heptosyltransferase II
MSSLGHVLLIRTDHLGDMLLTLPMVAALRGADPSCRVSVLASPANAEAARHHPDVDGVVVDPLEAKGSGLRGLRPLARQIAALRCDVAVVVHPTVRLALAVCLAGIRVRIGTAYRAYSLLFNRRVREHRRRGTQKHESEYNLNLLRPLGVAVQRPEPFSWSVTSAEQQHVAQRLSAHGCADARLVAVHPGSSGSTLNWPAARYAEVGRRVTRAGAMVVVTGSGSEAALVAEVVDAIGPGAIDLCGAFTLAELAALYQRCTFYVGGSTGPTHLAAAVRTPVIALYPPLRSGLPTRWRPLGRDVRVLQPSVNLVCPRCLGERCPYYHCMDQHLGVDAVWRVATELLSLRGSP